VAAEWNGLSGELCLQHGFGVCTPGFRTALEDALIAGQLLIDTKAGAGDVEEWIVPMKA
jgi:hypothetical protein